MQYSLINWFNTLRRTSEPKLFKFRRQSLANLMHLKKPKGPVNLRILILSSYGNKLIISNLSS